jgi:hypothetical protein
VSTAGKVVDGLPSVDERANPEDRLARGLLVRRAEVPMTASSVFCCRLLGLGLDYANALPTDRCRVYAVHAGGVEAADALAYFTRSPLTWLRPEALDDAVADPEIRGQLVYLVDDGLADPDLLIGMCALLKSGSPARLVLVVPFARAAFRRAALCWVDEVHTQLAQVPRRPLFYEQPDEDAARFLVERAKGYPFLPADFDGPLEATA